MPLRGGIFLHTLRNYRIAWIGGRYGGGKSAVSVRLGIEFLERGWVEHIIGNFPCVAFDSWRDMGELRDAFIILDEAGAWMKEKDFEDTVAFLRKRNLYLVLPSVMPPPIKARALNIQRTINFEIIGIPVWRYQMSLSYMNVFEQAALYWWKPREIFGLYDTADVATNSRGIVRYVRQAFYASRNERDDDDDIFYLLRERESGIARPALEASVAGVVGESEASVSSGNGLEGVEDLRRVASDLHEASQSFERSVSVYRKQRRRRRY